jgi:hypothetical protein
MAIVFETIGERLQNLPAHEAFWIESRVKSVKKMLEEREQFPDMLFEGRPYDEQTAHLRLLQYHRDSVERGFSDVRRHTMLDIAIEFGVAVGLPDDVMEANWLKASQEET